MELKLTGVARASLEELLLDYQDFLRQRGLPIWDKDSPPALAVRNRYKSDRSDPDVHRDPTPPRPPSGPRRAHQMCSVEMCLCRMDFSRADYSETSLSGNATSIRRFNMVVPAPRDNGEYRKCF